jgi:hypothetical protein
MLPENLACNSTDVTPTGERSTIHRNRIRVAIYVACISSGLVACVPAGWALYHAVQSIRVLKHAAGLIDALDSPTPIRSVLRFPAEVAPLCPQPEVSGPPPGPGNRFPLRTRFLKRFQRAPT